MEEQHRLLSVRFLCSMTVVEVRALSFQIQLPCFLLPRLPAMNDSARPLELKAQVTYLILL